MKNSNGQAAPDIIYAFSKSYIQERLRTYISYKYKDTKIPFKIEEGSETKTSRVGECSYSCTKESPGVYKTRTAFGAAYPYYGNLLMDITLEGKYAYKKEIKSDLFADYISGKISFSTRKKSEEYFMPESPKPNPPKVYIGKEMSEAKEFYASQGVEKCIPVPQLTIEENKEFGLKFNKFRCEMCIHIPNEVVENYYKNYRDYNLMGAELNKRYERKTHLRNDDTITLLFIYDWIKDINVPYATLPARLTNNHLIPLFPVFPIAKGAESLSNVNEVKYVFNGFFNKSFHDDIFLDNRFAGAYYVALNENTVSPYNEDLPTDSILGENAECTMRIKRSCIKPVFYKLLDEYMNVAVIARYQRNNLFTIMHRIQFKDGSIIKIKDYFDNTKTLFGNIQNDDKGQSFCKFNLSLPMPNGEDKKHITFTLHEYLDEDEDDQPCLFFSYKRADLDTDFGELSKFVDVFYKGLDQIFTPFENVENNNEKQLENALKVKLFKDTPEGIPLGDVIPLKTYFDYNYFCIDFVMNDNTKN